MPAPRNGTASATRPQAAESADEKAIRAGVELFTKSYAAHDAKAVAAHFTPNAEVINPDERVVKGRDAIEQVFANVFKTTPECTMEVDIESIRVLTPNLAIEEGVARTREAPNEDESLSPYVAIYSKLEGKWLLACVREWGEAAPELTPHDHLEELAWLVGDWVEESPQSVVRTSTTWSDNGNFLQQEFHVQTGGAIAMSGTVRIGWDAVRKQFKSWVFDSHGGHAEGYWLHVGGQWVIRSHGSTAAGEVASATNVYRLIDADTLGWRSYDRLVDGERQPDIDEIVVKRRPPAPGK
ncbi:MAG: SgcJ/EcaC family oxidoreductase [Planctomycetes bacterium]|nr:SgcJ/EcaC family oxidoreductase [Planctomycetota bacterium]